MLYIAIFFVVIFLGLLAIWLYESRAFLILPSLSIGHFLNRPAKYAVHQTLESVSPPIPITVPIPIEESQGGRKNTPFVSKEVYFPGARLLEDNWQTIREELDEVMGGVSEIPHFDVIDPVEERLVQTDGGIPWRMYVLKMYGQYTRKAQNECPLTCQLLKKIDRQISHAFFSILEPGKKIPPHFGPFHSVYRYHLGLRIPACHTASIIVDNRQYFWREGEGVLFDDTFRHEASNLSEETRVILFIDVYRHDLPKRVEFLHRLVEPLICLSPTYRKSVKLINQ